MDGSIGMNVRTFIKWVEFVAGSLSLDMNKEACCWVSQECFQLKVSKIPDWSSLLQLKNKRTRDARLLALVQWF